MRGNATGGRATGACNGTRLHEVAVLEVDSKGTYRKLSQVIESYQDLSQIDFEVGILEVVLEVALEVAFFEFHFGDHYLLASIAILGHRSDMGVRSLSKSLYHHMIVYT